VKEVETLHADLIEASPWSALIDGLPHPKRSFLLFLIISSAAAKFWNKTKNYKEFYATAKSRNPFRSTNSDVVVAEALIFYCHQICSFIDDAIENNELIEDDREALWAAGFMIRYMINEQTGWSMEEIFPSRVKEYRECSSTALSVEALVRVLLRSIGKQAIHDPDRLNLPSITDVPVKLHTMVHMKAWLPAYYEVYRRVADTCPMD
jgi:hypothetical protein